MQQFFTVKCTCLQVKVAEPVAEDLGTIRCSFSGEYSAFTTTVKPVKSGVTLTTTKKERDIKFEELLKQDNYTAVQLVELTLLICHLNN